MFACVVCLFVFFVFFSCHFLCIIESTPEPVFLYCTYRNRIIKIFNDRIKMETSMAFSKSAVHVTMPNFLCFYKSVSVSETCKSFFLLMLRSSHLFNNLSTLFLHVTSLLLQLLPHFLPKIQHPCSSSQFLSP